MASYNQFDDDRGRPLRRMSYLLQSGAGLIALIILGTGWLIAEALGNHSESLSQSTEQAIALQARGEQILQQHSELTSKVRAAQEDVKQAQTRLGMGPQESRFIAQLTDLAEEFGLDVSNVRPGGVSLHGTFGVLELQASCDGSYNGLCSFLAALNEMPRICHVSGMNVVAVDQQTGNLRFELKLQLLFALPSAGPETSMEKQA